MTNKQEKNTKIKLPIFSYVFFGIAALSLIIYIIAINNTGFADYFNRHISSFFRLVLAKISGIIPLSFAELFVICSPVILFIIIRFAMKRYIETWRHVGIFCVIVLSSDHGMKARSRRRRCGLWRTAVFMFIIGGRLVCFLPAAGGSSFERQRRELMSH